MNTVTINAHKQRNVATIDIPGAFLNAYNHKPSCSSETPLLNSWSKLTQIYTANILSTIKTTTLSYVKLSKAIYRLLKSALLFYKIFVADL
jgi:hypothetical protein